MKPEVRQAIDRLLPEPDRDDDLRACSRTPDGIPAIVARAKAADVVSVRAYTERRAPGVRVPIEVQRWLDGGFSAEYTMGVAISRLAPVYAIEHGFSVRNRHPEAIEPTLHGARDFGFIKAQEALRDAIEEILGGHGMTLLDTWDLDAPVPALLGSRWHTETCLPTVRRVLFEDVFELLDP